MAFPASGGGTAQGSTSSSSTLTRPTGFTWDSGLPDVSVIKSDVYKLSVRPDELIDLNSGTTFTNELFVDIDNPTASLGGDGSTFALATKVIGFAIDTAITSAQPTKIYIKGGVYPRGFGVCNLGVNKVITAPISLEAIGGPVYTGSFDLETWTKTSGQNNVYEVTKTNTSSLFNPSILDFKGSYTPYVKVATLAECDTTRGTWFNDGSKLFCHSHTGGPVTDFNARIYRNAFSAGIEGDHDVYIRGFNFEGGSRAALNLKAGVTNTCVLDCVTMKYAMSGAAENALGSVNTVDGLRCQGMGLLAAYNCEASYNSKDGFNYHVENGNLPSVMMEGCKGFGNGLMEAKTNSCNGVTAHDGLSLIDAGGQYLGSAGTNCGHINDNTHVWHVGTTAGDSLGDTVNGFSQTAGAFGLLSGSGSMWLEDCTDVSSQFGVISPNPAQTFIKNHRGTGVRTGDINTF